MKKWIKLCMIFCMTLSLAACGESKKKQESPKNEGFTIVDQAGRKVHFEQPAHKVVSAYYISTSTIIGLGKKDTLVGVEMKADTRAIYKQAAPKVSKLPAMGNKKSFNVEACAKANPDVVFLPIALESYVSKLEKLDMKVVLLQPETSQSYDEAVQLIAKILGAEKQADAYSAYRKKLYDTYIKKVDQKKRVYMAGSQLLEGAGKDMFQNDLLARAQAINAYQEGGKGWSEIGKETLLKMNPDVVFLEQGEANSSELMKEAAFAHMKAVQDKQVYTFPSTLETWDTPNLSSCLGVLWAYATLYPDRLSLQDVKKEAVKFYQTFYDIDVDPDSFGF